MHCCITWIMNGSIAMIVNEIVKFFSLHNDHRLWEVISFLSLRVNILSFLCLFKLIITSDFRHNRLVVRSILVKWKLSKLDLATDYRMSPQLCPHRWKLILSTCSQKLAYRRLKSPGMIFISFELGTVRMARNICGRTAVYLSIIF